MSDIVLTHDHVRKLTAAIAKVDGRGLRHFERINLVADAFGWKGDALMHHLKATTTGKSASSKTAPPQAHETDGFAKGDVEWTHLDITDVSVMLPRMWKLGAGVVLFTGRTGSGKSTAAMHMVRYLKGMGETVHFSSEFVGGVDQRMKALSQLAPATLVCEVRYPEDWLFVRDAVQHRHRVLVVYHSVADEVSQTLAGLRHFVGVEGGGLELINGMITLKSWRDEPGRSRYSFGSRYSFNQTMLDTDGLAELLSVMPAKAGEVHAKALQGGGLYVFSGTGSLARIESLSRACELAGVSQRTPVYTLNQHRIALLKDKNMPRGICCVSWSDAKRQPFDIAMILLRHHDVFVFHQEGDLKKALRDVLAHEANRGEFEHLVCAFDLNASEKGRPANGSWREVRFSSEDEVREFCGL